MTQPLRVLWFVNKPMPAVLRRLGLPPQFGGGWLDCQARALADRDGMQLAIACAASTQFPDFSDEGIAYFDVGQQRRATRLSRAVDAWSNCRADPDVVSQTSRAAGRFHPDVVHVHGTEYVYGMLAGALGHPTLVSLQGLLSSLERVERRGIDGFALQSLSLRQFAAGDGLVHHQRHLRRAAERERLILRTCAAFLGRTRFDEDVMRSINPHARYYHCDEIIRPAFWQATWLPRSLDTHVVFCTAGNYVRKGIGTLLRAVRLLRDQGLQPLTLRLAGVHVGSEDEHAVRRAAKHFGLSGALATLGPLPPEVLAEELRQAAVFAHPSHADNSPNSLAEAMLVGTPCVASSAGGIPSLARDNAEALLVPDGDEYALAGALLRLMSDGDLAVRLSQAARETARQRHDPRTVTDQLVSAYRSEFDRARRARQRPEGALHTKRRSPT